MAGRLRAEPTFPVGPEGLADPPIARALAALPLDLRSVVVLRGAWESARPA